MVDGMEKDQFLKFRMALLPASGFQSAQYRLIEICATDMINLVAISERDSIRDPNNVDELLERLYWRSGATELATGKKTLTLKQFEAKYMKEFREKGMHYTSTNLYALYRKNFSGDTEIIKSLREFDTLANVLWPLAHMRSAGHYLQKDPEDIKATGGTNWQKYLPPRFQKIIFFPDLWSEQEKSEWGRAAFLR
jgi:tryptophan 2,3-dioxygenase